MTPPTTRPRLALGVLLTLGLVLVAFVAATPTIAARAGFVVVIPTMVASGVLALAACAVARRAPERPALVIILGLAALMRILVMLDEPLLSTDIYRYVWDGRVQAARVNPYRHVPADPVLAHLRDASIFPNINRADYAVTAYPPVAEMFFLVVTRISESLTAMRLAMVGCEVVIIAVMLALLKNMAKPSTDVVTWAWHPLAVWEIAHSGHVEALMVALLLVAVWLLSRQRAVAGAVCVALAALVKPYALVLLPAFWRQWTWRMPAAVVATVAVCYLPYVGVGRGVLGFLASGYLSEEGIADGQSFWLVGLLQAALGPLPGLATVYLAVAAFMLAVLAWHAMTREPRDEQEAATAAGLLLMAGLVLLSPNYPWYFLGLVPFIALGGPALSLFSSTLTIAAPFLYRPWVLPHNELVWKTFATLPFLIAVVVVLTRKRASHGPYGVPQWMK